MRHYFTSLQVFLAAAFAMVVFIGILWVENSNFSKQDALKNPYDLASRVSERVVVVGGSEPKSWLHPTGELFLVMPGGKFNLINQSRELEEGVVFVNSNFQSESLINSAFAGPASPFSLEAATVGGGQYRVGAILVAVPQGMAVLKRDLVRQEATIYAHDHPAYVYLPEAKEPFIVPAGYTVLVKEKRAKVLGSLYFTKLKKELKLSPLKANTLGQESLQSALLMGLEKTNAWEAEISTYAEAKVVSENRFAPDSMMGKLFSGLAFIQRYYALGVDANFKHNYELKRLTAELKNVYYYFSSREKDAAIEAAVKFTAVRDSVEWARFFVEVPTTAANWSEFARAQRVWFYSIFPEDLETAALKQLWGPVSEWENFSDFNANYYLYETYLAKEYIVPARELLESMLLQFDTIDFEPQRDAKAVTQARRQVSLKLESAIEQNNQLVFELYIKLINAERSMLSDGTELNQEIKLEVAQDLLFFLDELLDTQNRQEEVVVLIEAYKTLEIAELSKSLGRSVFSQKEQATLERVKTVGEWSDEQINSILAGEQTASDVISLWIDIQNQPDIIEEQGPVGIQTEDDLQAFLEENDIQTQGIRVQVNEKNDAKFLTFNQLLFKGYSFQGTFDTKRQQFTFLKLGDVDESRSVFTSNFTGFLIKMVADNEDLKEAGGTVEEENQINNSTSSAIIRRRSIIELLRQQGLEARFDNVKMKNKPLTKAMIEEASFEKKYLLTFDFDLGPPTRIRNVNVQFGNSKVILAGQVFKLKSLNKDLIEAIDEKLGEEEDEG